jgi:DNA processing protein
VNASRPVAALTRRCHLRGRQAQRRDLCLWLGALSSWRGGLVGRLVAEFGSVDRVLQQDPVALRSLLAGGRRNGRRARGAAGEACSPSACSRRRQNLPAEKLSDEECFARVLALDPATCAASLERGEGGEAEVAWCDPLYPPAVRQLADAPLCLFVRAACGEAELARRLRHVCGAPAVAVVGTRAPSPYGEEMAAALGRDLTVRGVLVVSGLAMGIDAAAHAAALTARCDASVATVGVLGCGADVVYPRVNRRLFHDVEARGLLISEFTWGLGARAWRFPARNRIMAALSRGVVIVEGARRSGARLTVDYALEMGREVLAVPGEAGRKLTAAPHWYVRQGASLCESAGDVLRAIAIADSPVGAGLPAGLHPDLTRDLLERGSDTARVAEVLAALELGALNADQVAARCSLAAQEVAALLSQLEIDGLAQLCDGGLYRLRRT